MQDEAEYAKLGDARVMLHVEALFLFSLVWSAGGSAADNGARAAFDTFMRAAAAGKLQEYDSPSGEK